MFVAATLAVFEAAVFVTAAAAVFVAAAPESGLLQDHCRKWGRRGMQVKTTSEAVL